MSNTAALPAVRLAWAPWTDKKGRLHTLRATVFSLLLAPGLSLAGRYAANMLGPRALNELIHDTGFYACWFLIISLVITPLKAIGSMPNVAVVRRMIGNAALAYALIHLTLYITDQKWDLPHVASEIALRFYLTIGFVTLLGLIALGATSTDGSVRRLGKTWKRLHRIAYGLAALAIFHYTLQTKADVSLPLLAAGIYFWLMLWRMLPVGRDRGPLAMLGLTVGAALLTLLAEWSWYRFATHIDPMRVLRTELDIEFGLHPVGQVLALGLLATALMRLRALGQGKAGNTALFWIVLFGLGAWVDDAVVFIFGFSWDDDWEGLYWLWQNLAWTGLLALLGLARWLLRGSDRRRIVDALGVGCVVYQVVLAANNARSLEMAFATGLAALWTVLAWQTWQVSKWAALTLVPLGLLLAYGVVGLL